MKLCMKFEIVEEKKNPYLDRVECIIRIEHSGEPTPSKKDVSSFVLERLNYEPNKTLIAYIKTYTGMNVSEALIYYYPNGIDWSAIEPTKRDKVIKVGEEKSEA